MIRIKLICVLVALFFALILSGQISEISVRYANPVFDCNTKVYCVDVEYSTDMAADTMYGTNARFFFNSEVLNFREFTDFAPDYGLTNTIEEITGVGSSGASLFNFPQGDAATWINAGIQLLNQNSGVGMTQGAFTKYYSLCFDVVGSPSSINNFCPEIIWDLEEDTSKGGFFAGNDGVVITLKDGQQSTVSEESVQHMNWDYSGNGEAPYGEYAMMAGACITDDCVNCVAPSTAPTLIGGN